MSQGNMRATALGRFFPLNLDPAAYTYTKASFTLDGTWRDLDMSAIIPAGATAVWLHGRILGAYSGLRILFRRKGNSNTAEWGGLIFQFVTHWYHMYVPCSALRVIQYNASNDSANITNVDIVVMGYWT